MNRLIEKPYEGGVGRGRWEDDRYDCSGALSSAPHDADLLADPLDSSGLMRWGEPGSGTWITVYGRLSHALVEDGPRSRTERRSVRGCDTARHPRGL